MSDANARNLELTGEAATHIPDEIRQTNPQIPWRLILRSGGSWHDRTNHRLIEHCKQLLGYIPNCSPDLLLARRPRSHHKAVFSIGPKA